MDKRIEKELELLLDDFKQFMNRDCYIGLKEYQIFIQKHDDVYKRCKENKIEHNLYDKAIMIFEKKSELLNHHNQKFVDRKMIEYQDYFDHMFDSVDSHILLDQNQRKAILRDEDYLLVVAGAGSGKTTTMAAKVKYLIEKQNVHPKEIAVISFTNKATDGIKDRIHESFGYRDVDVLTFHKLGLRILRSSGYQFLDIMGEGEKYKLFSNYIKNQAFQDKDFFQNFNYYFNDKVYFDLDFKTFDSFKQYHNYAYEQKLKDQQFDLSKYNAVAIKKRTDILKTIRGEYVKSKEEVQIANFLYKNGIDYEYEKIYDKEVGSHKSYKPDFYIHQLNLHHYIEHFGVSENYINTRYTKKELENYLNTMKLKITFHGEKDNRDRFIITYSRYLDDLPLLEHLKKQLSTVGYQFHPRSEREIFERLRDTSEDAYFNQFIDRIIIPFISMFKGNNYDDRDFDDFIQKAPYPLNGQLKIMRNFYRYYESYLRKYAKVDFEDMINLAYKILPNMKESDMNVDYNYVIIDEYQDISTQRYNLTKRIADLFDAKIMAVGDDFQAIFGFAGAHVELFTDFKRYLEGAKMIPIVNTYRNSQELVDLASDFVLKNDQQLFKRLHALKHLEKPVEIYVYDDSRKFLSNYTKPLAISKIIGKIYEENPKQKILLIGRYQDDIKTLCHSNLFYQKNKEDVVCNLYPNAMLSFLTIHSAKGLGFDQCILINSSNEKYGFPSLIEDEPIMKILKPAISENIPYAEERRLFYVALTRTKNKVYIVTPSAKESPFIVEIKNHDNVLYHDQVIRYYKDIPTNFKCPDCKEKLIMENYKKTDFWIYYCPHCNFKTNTPKKGYPILNCPKCGDISFYRYMKQPDTLVYKCFNRECNQILNFKIEDIS